ncbi:MAG: hypothetical protein GXO96_06660 [Nitrospirae bacterium]|nr:hypothetical protein [Candidatus Manganitrophaceae bacterium]
MNKIIYVLMIALSLSVMPSAFAGQSHGLFVAYKNKDEVGYQQWRKNTMPLFQKHQCKSFRVGKIAATQGPLQWSESDHFTLLTCASPVLSSLVAGGYYKMLSGVVDNLRMAEGMLNIMLNEKNTLSPTSEYIIKVSYYNNLDVEGRNAELMEIGQQSTKISKSWTNDAVLTPTASMGFFRPDELTFLYYAESGQGKKFRENNPDMIKTIGAFNQNHTLDFAYLIGQSMP